jgi:hypothetical protein
MLRKGGGISFQKIPVPLGMSNSQFFHSLNFISFLSVIFCDVKWAFHALKEWFFAISHTEIKPLSPVLS